MYIVSLRGMFLFNKVDFTGILLVIVWKNHLLILYLISQISSKYIMFLLV